VASVCSPEQGDQLRLHMLVKGRHGLCMYDASVLLRWGACLHPASKVQLLQRRAAGKRASAGHGMSELVATQIVLWGMSVGWALPAVSVAGNLRCWSAC
jgi:hypothetical protein